MGDPKFQKKLYSTPRHPWEKVRIDAEREIINKYGLKNKRELWKSETYLKSIRAQARELQAKIRRNDENAIKQLNLLVKRLNRYKIISGNPTLDDILSLSIENILERRLQTVVFRKNLAVTVKQARQLIVHGHIKIGDTRVTIPSYLVEEKDEENITYTDKSPLSDEKHPVRLLLEGKEQKSEEAEVVE